LTECLKEVLDILEKENQEIVLVIKYSTPLKNTFADLSIKVLKMLN